MQTEKDDGNTTCAGTLPASKQHGVPFVDERVDSESPSTNTIIFPQYEGRPDVRELINYRSGIL